MNTNLMVVTRQERDRVQDHVDIMMIRALLDSLFTIFRTMVNVPITAGTPVPKSDRRARGDVSGVMIMRAERARGSVALSFPLPAIRELSQGLLGAEIDSAGPEAQDLVGELTNMLVGGAKRISAEHGYDFDMQIPTLSAEQGHEIRHLDAGQTVLLPIRMNRCEFYMELNFRGTH
jgi:chemotaxis protein CheX